MNPKHYSRMLCLPPSIPFSSLPESLVSNILSVGFSSLTQGRRFYPEVVEHLME